MKVSICVITYNHVNYIEETILSLLKQQCKFDFEIVVCDDSSNDGTSEICKNLANKHPEIKYYQHKENIGMMSNFQFAINQCIGEYIALCEGDDYWLDEKKIEKQLNFLENNYNFSVCASFVSILNELNQSYFTPCFDKTNLKYSDFAINGCSGVYTCTMFFKKTNALIDKINQNWFLNLDGADHFILLFLTSNGQKVFILNEVTAVYRMHSNGVWSSKSDENRMNDSKKNHSLYLENIRSDSKTKRYLSLSMLRQEYSMQNYRYHKSYFINKILRTLIYHFKFQFILMRTKL